MEMWTAFMWLRTRQEAGHPLILQGKEVLCQLRELTCQDDLSYQSTMWRKSNTTQYNTVYAFLYAYVLRTV